MSLNPLHPSSAGDAGVAQLAAWNRTLFEALIEQTRMRADKAAWEEALQWASVAGWFASLKGFHGELSSPSLEAELLRAASSLPLPAQNRRPGPLPRWLHVMTEAYGTLGHTNLCRRWIEFDTQVVHDVLLLDQRGPAPEALVSAARKSGGECVVLDALAPLMQRAAELRAYAWQHADVVVLHTHPEEVIATTAFGVAGGPPVLLVNHADHVFWVGCSVADMILDFRASGHAWTKRARGVDRATILPLPLSDITAPADAKPGDPSEKLKWRRQLGLPEKGVMLLTVGTAKQYQPLPGLDFVAAALEILGQCDDAYLVAVGPQDEGPWRKAREASGGRFMAVGQQPDSTRFCRAADVYLEGFPLGSVTALLEAGLAGLPFVRGPRQCVPYSTDSLSVDAVPVPENVQEYVRMGVGLAKNPGARAQEAAERRKTIQSHHCADGWLARLREIRSRIPAGHSVYPDFRAARIESHVSDLFLRFWFAGDSKPTPATLSLPLFIEAWKRTDAAPQIEPELWAALHGPGTSPDSGALSRLNQTIRRQGALARSLARGRLAITTGRPDVARTLAYGCLRTGVSCLANPEWIKLFIKAHSGQSVAGRLKSALQWVTSARTKVAFKRA